MTYPSASTLIAIAVLYGLLFAMVRRPWTAIGMLVYVLGFALIMSTVKEAYLGSAMSLADVRFFLMRPVENFHLFINYPVLGIALAGIVLGFVLCVALGVRFEQPIQHVAHICSGHWIRITTASASLILGTGAVLMSGTPAKSQANEAAAYAAFKDMFAATRVSGVVDRLNVFFNNRSNEATLPPQYAQTRFSEPASLAPPQPADLQPDIFLVLEESTFDPTLIAACKPSDCDNAMLHPPPGAQRSQQGPLLVHSTGGGTWLSEFAFMSGFDWRVFGPGGAYAPISLAPRVQNPLPARLQKLGYRTIAIYPTEGNFLSAKLAYRQYGFDEFYAASDLNLPDDWPQVRDQLVFEKALERIADSSDPRPVFAFVLTIRNHGPHGEGDIPTPKPFQPAIKTYGKYLTDYLVRMRDSSSDFAALAQRWLDSPRPRVIGWFGDHQPEAAWDFTPHPQLLKRERIAPNVNDQQLQYLTHYQLSANFGERQRVQSRDALDLAFLGAQLLSFAGLPPDAGDAATRDVIAACKGLLLNCADRKLVNEYLSYRIYQLAEMH